MAPSAEELAKALKKTSVEDFVKKFKNSENPLRGDQLVAVQDVLRELAAGAMDRLSQATAQPWPAQGMLPPPRESSGRRSRCWCMLSSLKALLILSLSLAAIDIKDLDFGDSILWQQFLAASFASFSIVLTPKSREIAMRISGRVQTTNILFNHLNGNDSFVEDLVNGLVEDGEVDLIDKEATRLKQALGNIIECML